MRSDGPEKESLRSIIFSLLLNPRNQGPWYQLGYRAAVVLATFLGIAATLAYAVWAFQQAGILSIHSIFCAFFGFSFLSYSVVVVIYDAAFWLMSGKPECPMYQPYYKGGCLLVLGIPFAGVFLFGAYLLLQGVMDAQQ